MSRLARRRARAGQGATRGTPSWSAAGCATFGPGTEDDLVWWLGATKAAVRAALADVGGGRGRRSTAAAPAGCSPTTSTPVDRGRAVGGAAAGARPDGDGLEGARLLPRPARPARSSTRNGNAGTTAWWDGRIVGCWVQDDDGVVEVRPARGRSPQTARAALDAEAARLTDWLDGIRVEHRLPVDGDEGRRSRREAYDRCETSPSRQAAARPAAPGPLRQARPAPVHQPPRLQPGLRAGGLPRPAADGLLVGLQPAPADLVRRRRADRVGQRGGVPRDRRSPRSSTPPRCTPRSTRRCPTASTCVEVVESPGGGARRPAAGQPLADRPAGRRSPRRRPRSRRSWRPTRCWCSG